MEQGTDLARQGHQLITRWADPDVRWRANTTLSYALLMAGNAADACDVAMAGVAELRRYGLDPATAAVTANAILALRLTGRWSEAEQLLDQALAIDPLPARETPRCCTWIGSNSTPRRAAWIELASTWNVRGRPRTVTRHPR